MCELGWFNIKSGDDLSIGECYFYWFEGDKTVSFSEFQGDGFSNEAECIEFDELFDFKRLWLKNFVWPDKPILS